MPPRSGPARPVRQRLDEQFERVTSHPAVKTEIKRIEDHIKQLEKQLNKLRNSAAPTKRVARKKPTATRKTKTKPKPKASKTRTKTGRAKKRSG